MKTPLYPDITYILFSIMLDHFELEMRYLKTGDKEILQQLEYLSWLMEYWENQMIKIHGEDIFDIRIFIS